MLLTWVLLFFVGDALIYFLDSNVHIRIFSNNEYSQSSDWSLIFYEYGHLETLTFGPPAKLWSFGTFDFYDYQVLELDVSCSPNCQTTDSPHHTIPNTGTVIPSMMNDGYFAITAVQPTKERVFMSWEAANNDQWTISRYSQDESDGSSGTTILEKSADQILGLTLDNSTVYYFTNYGDISFQEIGGSNGKLFHAPDSMPPRQIFWRDGALWILWYNGTTISNLDLETKRCIPIIHVGPGTVPPLKTYHIPSMTVTNDSLYYMVEDISVNLTVANWSLHRYSFFGEGGGYNQIPNNLTRPPVNGEVQLAPDATFIADSESVMTSVVTPSMDSTDYESRGVQIFVLLVSISSVLTVLLGLLTYKAMYTKM